MRMIATVGALAAVIALTPRTSVGNISVVRTRIAEVHAAGSDRGGKFGALTLAWGNEGARPELRTVRLIQQTKMTAPGKDARAAISFSDLKPGMTVVAEMSANRIGDTSWQLDALHVLDPDKPADAALVKILGSGPGGFLGRVTHISGAAPERKGDRGRLVVKREKDSLTFHITKDTEIVGQSPDGKQSALRFSDLRAGCEVVVSYPAPLVTGSPPQVVATRVIRLREAK